MSPLRFLNTASWLHWSSLCPPWLNRGATAQPDVKQAVCSSHRLHRSVEGSLSALWSQSRHADVSQGRGRREDREFSMGWKSTTECLGKPHPKTGLPARFPRARAGGTSTIVGRFARSGTETSGRRLCPFHIAFQQQPSYPWTADEGRHLSGLGVVGNAGGAQACSSCCGAAAGPEWTAPHTTSHRLCAWEEHARRGGTVPQQRQTRETANSPSVPGVARA